MSDEKKVIVLTDELRAGLAVELKALEDAAFSKGKTEGATAERERIKAIEESAIAGHDALVKEMKFDGKTTPAEAATRLLAAEKEKKVVAFDKLKADAAKPVDHVSVDPANPSAAKDPKTADPVALAREAETYRKQQAKDGNDISSVEAIRFVYARAGVPLR
jgi:hypothetical protein